MSLRGGCPERSVATLAPHVICQANHAGESKDPDEAISLKLEIALPPLCFAQREKGLSGNLCDGYPDLGMRACVRTLASPNLNLFHGKVRRTGKGSQ
jgi:hypothetical protein